MALTAADRLDNLPVLYSFRRCPYAMRARLALDHNDIAVELREVLLRDKPAHMIALSPKATVPVLWLADNTIIDESIDVMYWAYAQGGRGGALADDANHDLVALFDGDFKHHLDRYKYATRYDAATALVHRGAALEILQRVNARLTNDWLAGSDPGFVDLALLPFVRQYRIADIVWFESVDGIENVQTWLARFLEWPGFHAVMRKYPQWQIGEAGVRFGGDNAGA